jgi:hypothetical protein
MELTYPKKQNLNGVNEGGSILLASGELATVTKVVTTKDEITFTVEPNGTKIDSGDNIVYVALCHFPTFSEVEPVSYRKIEDVISAYPDVAWFPRDGGFCTGYDFDNWNSNPIRWLYITTIKD